MKRHASAFFLVLFASVLFQAWFLGLPPHGKELGDSKLSTLYTEALAHGQSYLLERPDPQHPLLDTSLYHDRHYLYFGIVPFVTVMAPWFKLTGSIPSPGAAILFFCTVGYLAYGSILLLAIRRWNPRISTAISGAAFTALIISSGTWPLMGRPAIYEIENAAAYAFLSLALLSLAISEFRRGNHQLGLMGSAALAALTIGCRPNYFPAVAVIGSWVLYRSWTWPANPVSRFRRTTAALAPLLLIGFALAWWNYHRFDDPLDFGLKHTVSEDPKLVRSLAKIGNFPYGAHRYALGSARLGRYFPFIQGQKEGPFALSPSQEVSNQVYGFLLISPILLCGALLLRRPRNTVAREFGGYATVLFGAFLGNFCFLACVTMGCYRYPADFLAPLSLLSAFGILGISAIGSKWIHRTLVVLLVPTLLWSICALIFQLFSTAQTTELFDTMRPADFAAAARPFNHAVYLYEKLRHDGPRALSVTVKLPTDRYGNVEPLVVDGENGSQDFLYLQYVKPGLIRVGFESTGHGGPVSAYTAIDYDKPHRFELRYGSFLPPDDHPLLKQFKAEDLALARRMITVLLDGQPVLDGWADFHFPRENFFIGQSPFDSAFGSRFGGEILAIEWPLLPAKPSPVRWEKTAYGPILLDVELVPMPQGVFDPLLSLGYENQGAQALVEHLPDSQVRLVWLDTQGQRFSSKPFAWPFHQLRKVEVKAGALLPPGTSGLWSAWISADERAKIRQMLEVTVDGKEVLIATCVSPAVSPNAVTVGKDTLYLTAGVMPSFSGSLGVFEREPWQPPPPR